MSSHQGYPLFATATLIVLSTLAILVPQAQQPPVPQAIGETRPSKPEYRKRVHPMASLAASENVIEILTLDIKPGRRDEFHELYVRKALPLLRKWNFRVVAYGPSLHDANSYYVIRMFKSLEDRRQSEDAYYSSDDWMQGPREAILGLVDHFAYAVVSAGTWKNVSMFDHDHDKEAPHDSKR